SSAGRAPPGRGRGFPLFNARRDRLLDSRPAPRVGREPRAKAAAREPFFQTKDYSAPRQQALAQRDHDAGPPYKPLPPDRLYLGEAEWRERLDAVALARLTPFALPEGQGPMIDIGAKQGRNFAGGRAEPGAKGLEAVPRP